MQKTAIAIPTMIAALFLYECASSPKEDQFFIVSIHPPEGYHINEEAPSAVSAVYMGEQLQSAETKLLPDVLTVSFPCPAITDETSIELRGTLYACTDADNATCYMLPFKFQSTLKKAGSAGQEKIDFTVAPPDLK